jgi:hypothetical protein
MIKRTGHQSHNGVAPTHGKSAIQTAAVQAAVQAAKAAREDPSSAHNTRAPNIATIRNNLKKNSLKEPIPKGTGKYTTDLDAAAPGKHTKGIYDSLNRTEAKLLAQVRTGMTHLNS